MADIVSDAIAFILIQNAGLNQAELIAQAERILAEIESFVAAAVDAGVGASTDVGDTGELAAPGQVAGGSTYFAPEIIGISELVTDENQPLSIQVTFRTFDGIVEKIYVIGPQNYESVAKLNQLVGLTDRQGSSVDRDLEITIRNVNEVPVIRTVDPIAFDENAPHAFIVTADDEEDGVLTKEVAIAPQNFETGPTGLLSVVITDGGGLSSFVGVPYSVRDVNEAPSGVTYTSAFDGQRLMITLQASDPDGNAIIYVRDGVQMVGNVITYTVAELATGAADTIVVAHDPYGLHGASLTIEPPRLAAEAAADNPLPPTILGFNIASLPENQIGTLTVTAYDAIDGVIRKDYAVPAQDYEATIAPVHAPIRMDVANLLARKADASVVSGRIHVDGMGNGSGSDKLENAIAIPFVVDRAGVVTISANVALSNWHHDESLQLHVVRNGSTFSINMDNPIATFGVASVTRHLVSGEENASISLDLSATLDVGNYFLIVDQDEPGADNSNYVIESVSASVLLPPPPPSERSISIPVEITNSGGLSTVGQATIAIANVNEAPTLNIFDGGVFANKPVIVSISEGNSVVAELVGFDPDGLSLIYSVVNVTGGATAQIHASAGGLVDSADFPFFGSGPVVRVSNLNYEAATAVSVTVRATDAGGFFVDRTLNINLSNVNEAPTIQIGNDQGPWTHKSGDWFYTPVYISDPDGDVPRIFIFDSAGIPLTFDKYPNGVDRLNGEFLRGTYTVVLGVQDGGGLISHDSYTFIGI
jgi:hypothetical protein